MKQLGKIKVVLGFHVNYNHSYRGDLNDDSGFGYDSEVIRGVIRILDDANARGMDARGTWDFDNFWSIQNCMARYAPDLLESMARRIGAGTDEAILDNWNNGIMSGMTREELRLSISRAISNEWGSGVKDRFGSYSPVVRSQEIMFTHGNIEVLAELGVKAICMYYSAVPFDGLRNFIPKLTPNERYNPLRLKSPVSDSEILVIPMYNQGDILDNISLESWLKKIRRRQEEGAIPGNALVYMNMDADAKIWTGMGMPKFMNRVPNMRGLEEYIEAVNKLDFAEFGTLGDYINNNPPVGEVRIDLDTADGSHTGYSSWTEKWINYPLWTLHQQSRRLERTANSLLREMKSDENLVAEVRNLLYGPGLSNIECRLLTASTTHFGLAAPMINPERLRVAFHFTDESYKKAERAVATLAEALEKKRESAEQKPAPVSKDEELELSLVFANKYENAAPPQASTILRLSVETPQPLLAQPLDLKLADESGRDVPFDFLNDGKTLCFAPSCTGEAVARYTLGRSSKATAKGSVRADSGILTNGLITVRIGDNGIKSLEFRGEQFSAAPVLSPGVTYNFRGRDTWFGPQRFSVASHEQGPRGRAASLTLECEFNIGPAQGGFTAIGRYELMLFEGVPYLYISGELSLPNTPCTRDDIGVATRISTKFDPNWKEVMPLHIRPVFSNMPGRFLKIWKHNFLNVTHAYELNFGTIDPANKDIDSLNNHITDGWLAVGNTERGLLLAHDQTVNTTFAMCPVRLRERDGRQTIYLNPFGCYAGRQLSHLPDGSGVARELMIAAVPSIETTAPNFNGRTVGFSVMLAPYFGDEPPADVQRDASLFSMPPLLLPTDGGADAPGRPEDALASTRYDFRGELDLDGCRGWTYADFLEAANSKSAPAGAPAHAQLPKVPVEILAKVARDTIVDMIKNKRKR